MKLRYIGAIVGCGVLALTVGCKAREYGETADTESVRVKVGEDNVYQLSMVPGDKVGSSTFYQFKVTYTNKTKAGVVKTGSFNPFLIPVRDTNASGNITKRGVLGTQPKSLTVSSAANQTGGFKPSEFLQFEVLTPREVSYLAALQDNKLLGDDSEINVLLVSLAADAKQSGGVSGFYMVPQGLSIETRTLLDLIETRVLINDDQEKVANFGKHVAEVAAKELKPDPALLNEAKGGNEAAGAAIVDEVQRARTRITAQVSVIERIASGYATKNAAALKLELAQKFKDRKPEIAAIAAKLSQGVPAKDDQKPLNIDIVQSFKDGAAVNSCAVIPLQQALDNVTQYTCGEGFTKKVSATFSQIFSFKGISRSLANARANVGNALNATQMQALKKTLQQPLPEGTQGPALDDSHEGDFAQVLSFVAERFDASVNELEVKKMMDGVETGTTPLKPSKKSASKKETTGTDSAPAAATDTPADATPPAGK